MYLEHYHLKLKPFDLSPGPKFLWLGEKHKEALATLNYGVVGGLGFLLLTGDVGVGKTALIHRLISGLDASTIVAYITDPSLSTLDFFRLLAAEFNIDSHFRSKGEFLFELEKFLHQAHAEHKKVLLIVDEAQRLNHTLLDQIRVLSNIELTDCKLINIFMVGQPEFKNMLMADNNRALRQRIAINYHVDPLTESETGQYIEHRLTVAGADRKIFKSDAIREVFKFTHGIPRAINIICDLALLTGYAAGLELIDAGVIRECGQSLDIQPDIVARKSFHRKNVYQKSNETVQAAAPLPLPDRSRFKRRALGIGMGIALVVLASAYLLWPPIPRWSIVPVSTPKPMSAPIKSAQKNPDTVLPGERSDEKPPPPASSQEPHRQARDTVDGNASPGDRPLPVDRQPMTAAIADPSTPQTNPLAARANIDAAATAETPKTVAATSVPTEPPAAAPSETSARQQPIPPLEEPRLAAVAADAPRQPATLTQPDGPPSNPSPVAPEVDDAVTASGSVKKESAVAIVSPAAIPPSAPEPVMQTGTPPRRTETAALTSAAAEKPTLAKGPGTPPSTPALALENTNTTADNQIDRQPSAKENTRPASDSPDPQATPQQPAPIITASTSPPARMPAEPEKRTAAGVEEPAIGDLEDRLRTFLRNYCTTYAAKNLNGFVDYFAAGALENGKPFASLLSKYERNFHHIETIQYRIELQRFSYDTNRASINIDGDFSLKWMPPDQKWRQNAGKISMHLKENGSSFLVQKLDYYSTLSKEKD